jgi:hypothetical protein
MKRVVSVFKYMTRDVARPVAIYYLVIMILYMLLLPWLTGRNDFTANGIESASLIFLFVMGLNMFKSGFLFTQANGVTRRHFYLGGLMGAAALAVFITAVDAVLYEAVRLFTANAQSLSRLIYPENGYIARILWTLAANLACVAGGWFVTMLYYRSGKALKLVISIGTPALLFVGLPILNSAAHGAVINGIGMFIAAVMGLSSRPDAWIGALSFTVLAVVLSALCYLFVRRAPVKS